MDRCGATVLELVVAGMMGLTSGLLLVGLGLAVFEVLF